MEIKAIGKSKTTLADIFGAYLPCKLIQSSEYISMYLLQTLDASWLKFVEQSTLKEVVCFLFALTVNRIVTISKPIKKLVCTVVRIVLG